MRGEAHTYIQDAVKPRARNAPESTSRAWTSGDGEIEILQVTCAHAVEHSGHFISSVTMLWDAGKFSLLIFFFREGCPDETLGSGPPALYCRAVGLPQPRRFSSAL
jgi:hypothetical protein